MDRCVFKSPSLNTLPQADELLQHCQIQVPQVSSSSSSSLMGVRGKPQMYRSLAGLLYRPI
jgi:hypothetical protein